jgi:hypothetical protein
MDGAKILCVCWIGSQTYRKHKVLEMWNRKLFSTPFFHQSLCAARLNITRSREGRAGLMPIIPIRPLPHECRTEAVWQRIIADQVRSSDPIMSVANDAGRETRWAAHAPLTGAELRCRSFIGFQPIRRCSIRKDAKRTKGDN